MSSFGLAPWRGVAFLGFESVCGLKICKVVGMRSLQFFPPTCHFRGGFSLFFAFFFFWLSCRCALWKWGRRAGCMWYVSYRVCFYAYARSLDLPSTKCGFLPVFVVLFNRCIVQLGVDDDGTRGFLYG